MSNSIPFEELKKDITYDILGAEEMNSFLVLSRNNNSINILDNKGIPKELSDKDFETKYRLCAVTESARESEMFKKIRHLHALANKYQNGLNQTDKEIKEIIKFNKGVSIENISNHLIELTESILNRVRENKIKVTFPYGEHKIKLKEEDSICNNELVKKLILIQELTYTRQIHEKFDSTSIIQLFLEEKLPSELVEKKALEKLTNENMFEMWTKQLTEINEKIKIMPNISIESNKVIIKREYELFFELKEKTSIYEEDSYKLSKESEQHLYQIFETIGNTLYKEKEDLVFYKIEI